MFWRQFYSGFARSATQSSPSSSSTLKPNIDTKGLEKLTKPTNIIKHFSKLLTREGKRGEHILAVVNAKLIEKYGKFNVIPTAIETIRPVLKYQKSKSKRIFNAISLYPKTANGIAMRWLIQSAGQRKYIGGRPCIERGLLDEIDQILDGSSALYAKRMNTHRNPN